LAPALEQAGAAALSVLTDGPFFPGRLEDLAAVREAVPLPLLRKDFVLEEYQLWESRVWGADAILLIVAILEPGALRDLRQAAKALGLAALVEVHTRGELERALDAGATLVGVNNRALQSFETGLDPSLTLLPLIPPGILRVSESGLWTRADVRSVVQAGAHAVLVGEALVRSGEIPAKVRELALLD
jgi:indole-3-glycerol phosphate synthase